MRIYSEIGFAYIDENGKMKNAIGIQMDEGNPIVIKKLAQKGMRRQSKSSMVKIFKNYEFAISEGWKAITYCGAPSGHRLVQ